MEYGLYGEFFRWHGSCLCKRKGKVHPAQAGIDDFPPLRKHSLAIEKLLRHSQLVITRFWRVLFLLMLVLLHVAALRGVEDFWTRALMLAHFGLFITWQPFMRGERRLTAAQVVGIVAISLGILFFINWWLLALWVSVLAGIVGGKVFLFQAQGLRRFYLIVLMYLAALLLVWIVPN